MSKHRKTISMDEFQQLGLLQEINRRFLHPIGLAMAVTQQTADGPMEFLGIQDSRQDPEGWIFDWSSYPDPEITIAEAQTRANHYDQEVEKRRVARERLLGRVVQPITLIPYKDPPVPVTMAEEPPEKRKFGRRR